MRAASPAMAAPETSLRKRKTGDADPAPGSPPAEGRDSADSPARLRPGTFWLTRIVLLKALAFVYFVAFLVALQQNKQLIGNRGLLPCKVYLTNIQRYFQGRRGWEALSSVPTVFWLLDWSDMNFNLDLLALLGLGISSFVLIAGCANMVLMAALWVLYLSLVNVGQVWYSFGWESQLLETGFLGVFLCPLWTLAPLPRRSPTSRVVLWGFRWLVFRIMLGAGLIKIRGDACWRDLTCMDFHYETQPVPNPMSYYLHRSPWWFHRFETLSNHFLELVVPFFLFLGRRMCILHGLLQILFQVVLIVSGNLSFLNWLTIVPSLACFDDATLGPLFPSGLRSLKCRVLAVQQEDARGAGPQPRLGCLVRRAANLSLGILVAWLSVPVVLNLLNSKQIMNTSFGPLRIVNSYGAFGSITKERTEVILQGTASPNASAPDAVWEDYEFKCKPDLRAQRVGHPPGRQAPRQRPRGPVPAGAQPLLRQRPSQVGPRRALQVQVQPPRGQTRRRGQVVGAEADRPLLPGAQPARPAGLLQGPRVAAPEAGQARGVK
ncbi:lipase maturation factor 1 isoform X2 [Microcebus murinus]|uniref:lipase maturation factor 1 isoform X2 n=1 Tax=Microcebus murinus TaxID=30608 RepID=UPI003F6D8D68